MRQTLMATALVVSACNSTTGSVYDEPLPKSDGIDAITRIKDGVKPEDAEAWQSISMIIIMPTAKRPTSTTVGEAISRYKAREACTDKHNVTRLGEGPSDLGAADYETRQRVYVAAYNKEVDAYNACQKMPL